MQHAIRASGVACQPAQTATFPTHKANAATSAAARPNIVTVHLACGTQPVVSNPYSKRELLETFNRAGFSQVRFSRFPLAVSYLAAWGYVIEAQK